MPSRMALVLRGDAYNSLLSNEAWTSSPVDQGDPLWGALARGAVSLVKGGIGLAKSSKAKKVLTAGGAVVGAVTAGGVGAAIEKYVTKRSGATAAAMPMVAGGCGAKGYHVIRRGPNAGRLTRNRRMRVTNPKALRRAIRRATGFARLAKKVMKFTSPRGGKGRAYFKAPKRRKF